MTHTHENKLLWILLTVSIAIASFLGGYIEGGDKCWKFVMYNGAYIKLPDGTTQKGEVK